MPIITSHYHKKQIKELNNLISKAFLLKHRHYWHLIKWKEKHKKELKEQDR